MTPVSAINLVVRHRLDISKDFFTLSPFEVGQVLDAADDWKYRKPKQANGSRGRYFYALLQRSIRLQDVEVLEHVRAANR